MGDVILRGVPIDLNSDIGRAFVVDATRAAEGLIEDRELSDKYELSPADWQAIMKDVALGHAVRAERERRVRDGTAVREMAAKVLIKGPGILDGIMTRADSNPKHKIEAYKELRQTAAIGDSAEGRSDSDRYVITIVMGEDEVVHFNKPRRPRKSTKIDISDQDVLEGKPDDE